MNKKILFNALLFSSLGIVYVTTSSHDNGNMVSNGTSCGTAGSCHDVKNTATTVNLLGIPAKYTPNQTYSITIEIKNTALPKGGFNANCSAGTFATNNGNTTVKLSTDKLNATHASVVNATGGAVSYDFKWKAPASGPVSFNIVGNAVNGDNQPNSLDKWNTQSYTITPVPAASIEDAAINNISVYPNPAVESITIKDFEGNIQNIIAFDITGKKISLPIISKANKTCVVDCASLVAGTYHLQANVDGKVFTKRFTKN